jgi:hypothetical protein
MFKKIAATTVVFAFLLSSAPVFAEDETEKTLLDSLSGGVVGGLIGLVVTAFTSEPDKEAGKEEVNLQLPLTKREVVYEPIVDDNEVIFGMDLFSYTF